jgi:hypothetical protein
MPPPKIWRLYIYEDYSQPRIHKSSLMSGLLKVRLPPDGDRIADIAACPSRAGTVL